MPNAKLDDSEDGIKIARRNINNLRYVVNTTLMVESEESPDEGERGEWKIWLKIQHSETKIMASGPITSWQIDGETMETVTDLFSWAPKSLWVVTAAIKLKDACFLEEKQWQT